MIEIGGVKPKSSVFLAPLAGFTDAGFRGLCAQYGAGLTYTEMVSAKGMCYGNRGTDALLYTTPAESPKAVQLFGSEPEFMYRAAKDERIAKFDIADINMGCPVRKIVSNGDGSALMENPSLIEETVRAVKEGFGKPVTVKLRAGVRQGEPLVTECAVAAERGGADCVTVHPRYREQMYAGQADHELTAAVKSTLKIPVIANGDVVDALSFWRVKRESGADAVMVGRGALGKPWIFSLLNWADSLEDGFVYDGSGNVREDAVRAAAVKAHEIASHFDAKRAAREHVSTLREFLPDRTVVNAMKLHLCHYAKNTSNAKEVKLAAAASSTIEDTFGIIDDLL